MLNCVAGKACSMDVQMYIDEEEELDTQGDPISMTRISQVSPEESKPPSPLSSFTIHISSSFSVLVSVLRLRKPVNIESVVQWPAIANKYLTMQGFEVSSETTQDEFDAAQAHSLHNHHNNKQ